MYSLPALIAVGVATLDVINLGEQYSAEDSEVCALAQSQRMKGNAANTAVRRNGYIPGTSCQMQTFVIRVRGDP